MKCTRQPKFLIGKPTPITALWEVRMPITLWQRVCAIAGVRETTFSAITRFCAFALAERNCLRWRKTLKELREVDKKEYSEGKHHRHIVCLYGEDVRLLQLAAMQLGISVSALIRIALRLYLRRLATEIHSRRYVTEACMFWRGIKRWIAIPLTALNDLTLPVLRSFTFQSFPPELRWGYPEGSLPILSSEFME
jgi:hypothetical protein